ncbi:MAG: MFS transporter [Actinomycetota bacterium]
MSTGWSGSPVPSSRSTESSTSSVHAKRWPPSRKAERASPAWNSPGRSLTPAHSASTTCSTTSCRAIDVDASVTAILLAFAALRAVTALASYPAGRLVDTTSARAVVVAGMSIAAVSVATASLADAPALVWVALLGAGLAEALTKVPVKAWLIGLGPAAARSSVLGDRAAIAGGGALVSGVLVGIAWGGDGRVALLVASAVAATGAIVARTVSMPEVSTEAVSSHREETS